MSNPPMYTNLVALDREQHKKLRLSTERSSLDRIQGFNSLFVAVAEFAEACREFPVVFVRVGAAAPEGKRQAIAPLAVFGLKPSSNLFVEGDKWTGRYLPAYIRRYPFAMARVAEGSDDMAMCIDQSWEGFSETEGEPLFGEDGQPTQLLLNAKEFVENFEREAERTRQACEILLDLDLLQEMRFEAALPSGEKIDVEGFLTVNEQKLAELPDAKVVELHRNGMLAVIEMHRISLGNMSRLAAMYQTA